MGKMVFGRYYPGSSLVHDMDARAKLSIMFFYMVAVLCCANPYALGACVAFTFAFYLAARIPARVAVGAVLPLSFIVVLAMLANLLFIQQGTVYADWGFFKITEGGVYQCFFMGIRLSMLLFGACLVTLTTTTLDITDAFEAILKPFARFGVPAHELSMIMGIALRFLPQFMEELAYTRSAQLSRGARLSEGSASERVGALKALFIPLFASVFRHAETLAGAMDARCYHGGPGRGRLHPLSYSWRDAAGVVAFLLMVAAIVACNLAL
ncbi:MAG: energy-coupling factor transporter transmembrane component T [Coriobacteriia bacterium]|nr:energy-coupling factor transporter transmembrane component T [Coriobacteriia bacterium]